MDPAVIIDPQPGLRIVAAVALHAPFDRLVLSRGFGGDDSADGETDRGTGGRRTGIAAATAADRLGRRGRATAPLRTL